MAFFVKLKAFFAAVIAFILGLFGAKPSTPVTPAVVPVTEDPAITSGISDEDYFNNYFEPTLRFVVASDIHIHDKYTEKEEERLALLFDTAYAYAEAQSYNKLDGIFFVGDIVDRGTESSFKKFFSIANAGVKDGTVMRAVLGNHEFFDNSSEAVARFLRTSGYSETDIDINLNGYHFIMLAPLNGGRGYTEEQKKWLENAIKNALSEDETKIKPIFVFQHHNVRDTVYGSQAWGVSDLSSILSKYPNVVDFSGHSHYPVNDPRAIWQGTFTALNDGSLTYYEMGLNGVTDRATYPSDNAGGYANSRVSRDDSQYLMVEVDNNHSIIIRGYDLDSNTLVAEHTIRAVGNTEWFDYTDARADASAAPAFTKSAKITLVRTRTDGAVFEIPQAFCEDYVESYRFEIYDANGNKVKTSYSLSDAFYVPTPSKIRNTVSGLNPDMEYLVKCYAVNAWGKLSDPIMLKFRTLEKRTAVTCYDSAITPDVFSLVQYEDGQAYDGVSGKELTMKGLPEVAFDKTAGHYAPVFNGSDCYMFSDFSSFYSSITTGVSVEYYGTVTALSNSNDEYADLISNQQNGGLGFDVYPDGKIDFNISINGSYKHAYGQIKENTPVHLVATYDGETVCLYVNSELADTTPAKGEITFPSSTGAQFLCIGADSANNGAVTNNSVGMITIANVYGRALTAAEVSTLCGQYN